jgi:cell division protein FtsB
MSGELYDEIDILMVDNEALRRENQLLKSQNHELVRKIHNLEHMLNRQRLSVTGIIW